MEVLIPRQMATIIDTGIMGGNMSYVWKRGALLLLMAVSALLFGVIAGRYASVAAAGYAKNLRRDILYNVQDFSFRQIDKFSTSSLVTRTTTDITNIQTAFMMTIRLMSRTPIMIVLALFMTLSISPKIALIFLAALPFLGLIMFVIVRLAEKYYAAVYKEYDKLNERVQENVNGARVVKAFVRRAHEQEKFEAQSAVLARMSRRAEKTVNLNMPALQLTIYCVMLGVLFTGGRDIVFGTMLPGELTSVVVYAIQILISLMMVAFVFVINMIAQASKRRVREVLNETADMETVPNGIRTVSDGSVSFRDVTFGYGGSAGAPVLKEIQVDIPAGATVGIIGGTGSGKSTLVQLIPRLYDVDAGKVMVGGHDVRDYDLTTLRDSVAMVLQKNVLFKGTIAENLRWGNPAATDDELRTACEWACADDFIRTFPDGYDTEIQQGGSNVSGGQKQRLCIARALLKRPKILILDDATSAVDTKTDAKIRDALHQDLPGMTKIIIGQRIAAIEDADFIVVMEDGRINGAGTSAQLLETNAIYREIYESQMRGGDVDA